MPFTFSVLQILQVSADVLSSAVLLLSLLATVILMSTFWAFTESLFWEKVVADKNNVVMKCSNEK
jgi:hypothetical protein